MNIVEARKNPLPPDPRNPNPNKSPEIELLVQTLMRMDSRITAEVSSINETLVALATHLQELESPPTPTLPKEITPVDTDWNPEKTDMVLWKNDKDGISWENHYRGSKIFLVCGGPSLNTLDLSLLDNRGVMSMALNNAWCMVKPDFWMGFDVPGRFHTNGWMDPSIMKIVPWHRRNREINHRVGDEIVDMGINTWSVPNCWYLSNNTDFDLDTWFSQKSANWGGKIGGLDPAGGFKVTMIGALRVLYYLGFQEVYLVGCDWGMPMDMEVEPYAWEENRAESVREKNNAMYDWVGGVLKKLIPGFKKAGFRVYNCNRESKLTLFPFINYEDAVERCRIPEMKDTRGWYDIKNEKEEKSGP